MSDCGKGWRMLFSVGSLAATHGPELRGLNIAAAMSLPREGRRDPFPRAVLPIPQLGNRLSLTRGASPRKLLTSTS